MKKLRASLRCLAVAAASLAFVSTVTGQNAASADRYIVTLNPGNQAAQVAAAHGVNPRQVYTHVLNGFAANVPPGRLAALANDPRVASIAVDHRVFAIAKPVKPPTEPPPSGQVLPAGVARVGVNLVPQTGAGVGVAILDTGVDLNHLDLSVSMEWSFVSKDFTYTDSAQDDAGHGTHVAGIVAALNNTRDVVGVAPGATIYAVKVLDNTGSGYDSDIAAGLDAVVADAAVVDPAIRVINMSLGRPASGNDSVMHDAIKRVVAAGISVVVAAGNDPNAVVSQMVPAGFPEVIAVASTTAKTGTSNNRRYAPIPADTASYFTTDGAYNLQTRIGVAISAPGEEQENIQFPSINSLGILSTALRGGTTRMSGTSMAAPHVAGVVALLLQKSSLLTPADVKASILGSGDRAYTAPLNSPTSSYSFDGEREGILYAPNVLAD